MTDVWINSIRYKPSNSDLIGEGGEAEIYKIDAATVLKLFKGPGHSQFQGNTAEARAMRDAAARRLSEQQAKLPAFPPGLPPAVVAPAAIATERPAGAGSVVGYTMPLIQSAHTLRDYSQRSFRENANIGFGEILELFLQLHEIVTDLHSRNIVIGDFNPMNVLIAGKKAFVIDADSMQFGNFQSTTFCANYVDPLICRSDARAPIMVAPHSQTSDWYAFAILLWECLLYVHPYGGVFKPNDPATRVGPSERPLKRISVLHNEVRYPVAAIPFSNLPSSVVDYYRAMLVHDAREPFPKNFLENMKFKDDKGYLVCNSPVPASGADVAPVCRTIFRTQGHILRVSLEGSRLRYLYHDNNKFVRENGVAVMTGARDLSMNFRIHGDCTIISKAGKTFLLASHAAPLAINAEPYRNGDSVFDANAEAYVWAEGGFLWQSSARGPRQLAEILSRQTRIWLGPSFGFAYSQAGDFRRAFIFDSVNGKCPVDIGIVHGTLLDAQCLFSDRTVWFLMTVKTGSRILNHCYLFDSNGNMIASAETEEGDEGWLGRLSGKCAATVKAAGKILEVLFAATINGVVQVAANGSKLQVEKVFNETAGLVSPDENLLYSNDGLYVWNSREVKIVTNGRSVNRDLRPNLSTTRGPLC